MTSPPPTPSSAIPIPGAASSDSDWSDASDSEISEQWASPGAGSYVSRAESWRAVPPPMLASSLDRRFRPSLVQRPPTDQQHPLPPLPPRVRKEKVKQDQEVDQNQGVNRDEKKKTGHEVVVDECGTADDGGLRYGSVDLEQGKEVEIVQKSTVKQKLDRLMEQMKEINEAPRELWLIFALKFLSSYAYFSLSLILTIFLTNEFGMSDTAAGWAYGAYGVMSTFFGFLCGWFIDYLGVRASLLVGSLVGAAARLVVALTLSRHTAMLMLYTCLPFAECLGIPIMTIGIKRYTNARNRTFAFSLFYSVMNVAALLAGPLVDCFRNMFGNGVAVHIFPFEHEFNLSALRLVILTSSIATAAMCVVVLFGIREIHVDESGNLSEFTPNRESPMQQTMQVLREPAFWRLTVFTVLLVGVRLVFRHIDATMPKYLTREFGPMAPFGMIYAINPFLIIFLVPLVGLVTRKIDSFSMIMAGSFVSAASPFWLSLDQTYTNVVLFMVTLSLGEAVYSPRVYEYTMEVSAHGAEGLYSSLSTAPLFSVQLLVGGMSGWLLTSFMPEDGPHHGRVLWTIVGIMSMTSPIAMWMLRGYISPSDSTVANERATGSNYEHTQRKSGAGQASGENLKKEKGESRSLLMPSVET